MSFGESVTVSAGTEPDENRNQRPIGGPTVTIRGCVIEPLGGSELIALGRNNITEAVRVYVTGPLPREIQHGEVLTARGLEYRIAKQPSIWIDPDGDELGGAVIEAQRAKG